MNLTFNLKLIQNNINMDNRLRDRIETIKNGMQTCLNTIQLSLEQPHERGTAISLIHYIKNEGLCFGVMSIKVSEPHNRYLELKDLANLTADLKKLNDTNWNDLQDFENWVIGLKPKYGSVQYQFIPTGERISVN